MVDLRELCRVAALEPLDHVELPQRTAAVEGARDEARALLAQLPRVARRRQPDVAHVEVEVEVRILDPVGMIEAQLHLHQAPPIRRQQVQPVLDQLLDVVEADGSRRGGRVEDGEAGDVPVGGGRLHVEEARIEPGELLHRGASGGWAGAMLLKRRRRGAIRSTVG